MSRCRPSWTTRAVLLFVLGWSTAACTKLEITFPPENAPVKGAYLPVRGQTNIGDPGSHRAVALLTPTGGASAGAPVKGVSPVLDSGTFQIPLVDVLDGNYTLTVWIEDGNSREKKIEASRALVFALGPPRLKVEKLDALRDKVIQEELPVQLTVDLESDLGARVSAQVNEKRIRPVQLMKLPSHTFTLDLEEGVNIITIMARNSLNDGPSVSFSVTVEAPEEDAPEAPKVDPEVVAAQKELRALAKAKDIEGIRTRLEKARTELGSRFRDKAQYARRLRRADFLLEKLQKQVDDDNTVCDAVVTADRLHSDKLFRDGYQESKDLAAQAKSACDEQKAEKEAARLAAQPDVTFQEVPEEFKKPPPQVKVTRGFDDDDDDMPSVDALGGAGTTTKTAPPPAQSPEPMDDDDDDMPSVDALGGEGEGTDVAANTTAVAPPAGRSVDDILKDVGPLCGQGRYKDAAKLIDDIRKREPSRLTPQLALCGARGAYEANDCKAATPLAKMAASVGDADIGEGARLKLIEGVCASKSGKGKAAFAALSQVVNKLAGGAALSPKDVVKAAKTLVKHSSNKEQADGAISPCKGKTGLCIAMVKTAERAIGEKYPAKLTVAFEKKGCTLNLIDPATSKIKKKFNGKKLSETFIAPAGNWRVVIACPNVKRAMPDTHQVSLAAGGTATIQHKLELNPNVMVKITPPAAKFLIDNKPANGKNGIFQFNQKNEVVTKQFRIQADGYHTEKGSLRVNKISDEFKIALANKAALARFDKGIEARRQAQLRKAVDEFNQALLLDNNFSQATLMLGLTQYQLKDLKGAKATLQRLINLDNDTRYTTIARFYLAAQDLIAAIDDGGNLARFEKVAKKMKRAQRRVKSLYSVLPSMDQSPVPYRDDAQYWVAKALYHQWKAAADAGGDAGAVKKQCKAARKAWKKVKSRVVTFVSSRRVEYDTEYKAERKEVLKELKSACK